MNNIAVKTITENTARAVAQGRAAGVRGQGSVVEIHPGNRDRESLSENFNDELEAWARHGLAWSGFGNY